MAVLKTTSPPTDPAAPNARPDISVPSSSNSFIPTGVVMRGQPIRSAIVRASRSPLGSVYGFSEGPEASKIRLNGGAKNCRLTQPQIDCPKRLPAPRGAPSLGNDPLLLLQRALRAAKPSMYA